MPYITNKKRKNLIKLINKNYIFKKTIIFISIALTLAFIALLVVSLWKWLEAGQNFIADAHLPVNPKDVLHAQANQGWSLFTYTVIDAGHEKWTLSGFGIGMAVWLGIITLLDVILIFIALGMKSPAKVKADIKVLESAALSGKKLEAHVNTAEVMRQRRNPKNAKKKRK